MIRLILLLLAAITIYSCSNEPYYEKEFYEMVSGIKFPKSATALESIDNGEFVTTTVFQVDSMDLQEFLLAYKFDTTEKHFSLGLLGNSYLITNKVEDIRVRGFYYKEGSKAKNSWLYLVNVKTNKLWAEIRYPDFSGN